jgi:proteasome lid subunit RPN8/RPN11
MFAASGITAVGLGLIRKALKTTHMADFLDHASKSDAEHHALKQAPHEACGLLVIIDQKQHYWPCRNLCDDPDKHFVLDPRDYLRAALTGTIAAIIHSHPQGQRASGADRKACSQSRLPWFIYQVPQQQWLTINP